MTFLLEKCHFTYWQVCLSNCGSVQNVIQRVKGESCREGSLLVSDRFNCPYELFNKFCIVIRKDLSAGDGVTTRSGRPRQLGGHRTSRRNFSYQYHFRLS